jgi:hypothetical protein
MPLSAALDVANLSLDVRLSPRLEAVAHAALLAFLSSSAVICPKTCIYSARRLPSHLPICRITFRHVKGCSLSLQMEGRIPKFGSMSRHSVRQTMFWLVFGDHRAEGAGWSQVMFEPPSNAITVHQR